MKVGRRLAIKILNASRFALSRRRGAPGRRRSPRRIDLPMLGDLARVVEEATTAFDGYDYARALERTEAFFWSFCDDYLELVKTGPTRTPAEPGPASARAALASPCRCCCACSPRSSLSSPKRCGRGGTRARSTGPRGPGRRSGPAPAGPRGTIGVLDMVAAECSVWCAGQGDGRSVSMRAPVAKLTVIDSPERLALLRQAESDLRDAGGVAELVLREGAPEVIVELARRRERRALMAGDERPGAGDHAELETGHEMVSVSHARLVATVSPSTTTARARAEPAARGGSSASRHPSRPQRRRPHPHAAVAVPAGTPSRRTPGGREERAGRHRGRRRHKTPPSCSRTCAVS